MSHFTVLCIGGNIDEQLAPYDENLDCPERNVGIVDREERLRFINYYAKEQGRKNEYKVVLHKLFEKMYAKKGDDWNGNRWRKENGRWYEFTAYNPDSKWDWYQIGGRWEGSLLLKNGAKVDSALKGNIDIQRMRNNARTDYLEAYDIVASAFGGTIPKLDILWSEITKKDELDIDQKRDLYHSQKAMKLLKRVKARKSLTEEQNGHLNSFYFDLEKYQTTRDEYGQLGYNSALTFYSVVKDGKWYQQGDMGWWGMSSNEIDENDWNAEITLLIDDCPADTELTVVDCHI